MPRRGLPGPARRTAGVPLGPNPQPLTSLTSQHPTPPLKAREAHGAPQAVCQAPQHPAPHPRVRGAAALEGAHLPVHPVSAPSRRPGWLFGRSAGRLLGQAARGLFCVPHSTCIPPPPPPPPRPPTRHPHPHPPPPPLQPPPRPPTRHPHPHPHPSTPTSHPHPPTLQPPPPPPPFNPHPPTPPGTTSTTTPLT
jgi:hypothetical protein